MHSLLEKALYILGEVEFSGFKEGYGITLRCCPLCGVHTGHTDNCRLVELIEEVREELSK